MVKNLYILRGPSGIGKSTLAKTMSDVVFSTDDFFMKNGKYVFDSKKLNENHGKNQSRTEEAMVQGVESIVVDNTFTQAWEMKFYVEKGLEYGYNIHFIEPNWNQNLRRKNGKWNADFIKQLQAMREANGGKRILNNVIDRMVARYDYNVTIEFILKSLPPWERKKY